MSARRRPTIRSIAEHVGLSSATVSYALRGKGALSEETRRRVLQAARELGYPLHETHEGPEMIGVLFPPAFETHSLRRHDIFGAFAQGIEQAVRSVTGCVVSYVPNDPDSFPFQHLLQRGVDGVVYIGIDVKDPTVELMRSKGIPIVLINHRGTHGVSSVSVAHHAAMRSLTDHLIEVHGYRRFIYLKGGPVTYTAERLSGAMESIRLHGLSEEDVQIVSYENGLDEPEQTVMASLPNVDAVIADRADFAVRLIRRLQKRGLKMPQDLAVVGFDDLSIGTDTDPPLTTIAFDAQEIARRATEILISVIRGDIVDAHIELPFELKVRLSCGCTPPPETGKK